MGAEMARGLVPTGLDQLWIADITHVRLLEKSAYVAVLLDAFSRRVIGWALDKHLRANSPPRLSAWRSRHAGCAGGQTVGWFYFRHNEETARQAKVLTRNEAGS